jgi:hypothetical protein
MSFPYPKPLHILLSITEWNPEFLPGLQGLTQFGVQHLFDIICHYSCPHKQTGLLAVSPKSQMFPSQSLWTHLELSFPISMAPSFLSFWSLLNYPFPGSNFSLSFASVPFLFSFKALMMTCYNHWLSMVRMWAPGE